MSGIFRPALDAAPRKLTILQTTDIHGAIGDEKSPGLLQIASAVEAGILGLEMFEAGNQFFGGDGIVKKGVENTIASVSRLAKLGMAETDKEIIRLMLED